MKVCKSWAVAVVYLLEKEGTSSGDIYDYVKNSDLTELGERGDNPEKTLWSMLTTKAINGCAVFNEEWKDYFTLYYDEEDIKEHSEVKLVYEKLEQKEKVEKIIREHQQLKDKLQTIKQLCDEVR